VLSSVLLRTVSFYNLTWLWAENWQMEFNPSKCLHLTISNKHHHFNHSYYISNHFMQKVSHAKYVGVIFDEHITWKNHIRDICAKANAALAFIKRNINSCPNYIKSNWYKTFVRPILEYASPIWVPHLQVDISTLEKVQYTAARYALNDYSWRNSVTAMLKSLEWPTLKPRCVYSKLVMFYKIINSHIEVPSLFLNPIHIHQYTHPPGVSHNVSGHHMPSLTLTFSPSCLQPLNYGTIFQKTFSISHLCLIFKNLYIAYMYCSYCSYAFILLNSPVYLCVMDSVQSFTQ